MRKSGEIDEAKVFESGFTWKPRICNVSDYKILKNSYNLTGTHLFLLCGVSTAGKDTLLHEAKKYVEHIAMIPRATSRPPRPGEVNGVHYFFNMEDSILFSSYGGFSYAITGNVFKRLIQVKKGIMIQGIVYGAIMKDLVENLGGKITIVYLLPGALNDSLQTIKQTVLKRLPIRHANVMRERIDSVLHELQTVLLNKEFLAKLGVQFIENIPDKQGYSLEAVKKLVLLLREA